MKRVILITDIDTSLGEELVKRYLEKGYRVAAACTNPEKNTDSGNENLLILDWKRRSAISARNVILRLLTQYDQIDEALILESPLLERNLLQEVSFSAIESAVDQWIKGTLFLIKEILRIYTKRKEGILSLVNYSQQESGGLFPPLESALRGSFQAMAQSLFASNAQKNVCINGFESYCPRIKEFADFIVNTRFEKKRCLSGKWFRFQTKSRLFSSLRF